MKLNIKRVLPNLKTLYDRSPQRFWRVIGLISLTLTMAMLVFGFLISRDFFINITLNFIVTAIGMIVTFIFFDKRIDQVREKIDIQRNTLLFEKLNKLEELLETIDGNTKLLSEPSINVQTIDQLFGKLNKLEEILQTIDTNRKRSMEPNSQEPKASIQHAKNTRKPKKK